MSSLKTSVETKADSAGQAGNSSSSQKESVLPRLQGLKKSFRRISFHFATSPRPEANGTPSPEPLNGNVEEKKEESDEPRKKASALEEENLSKILHRRSRPRSQKYSPIKLTDEQIAQQQQMLQQQQKQ